MEQREYEVENECRYKELQDEPKEVCKYEQLGCDRMCEGLSKISGKWKLKLLYLIGYEEVIRYGQLKRNADPISHKVLSSQLKELEQDGLILRTEYPTIPPKVEYSLTKKGIGLLPMFDALYEWIVTYEIGVKNDAWINNPEGEFCRKR